ncbi:hypothetical protein BaRGS_00040028 [Batillaria attramentaria]|uniref:Uncharacterized protein n=1 Tax=Batillaria attramentaria TaxID=370345 RepID=A0ABD0J1Q4_9CAEN
MFSVNNKTKPNSLRPIIGPAFKSPIVTIPNLAERPPAIGCLLNKGNYQATSHLIPHRLSSMEKRVAALLNSSKSGNILDKESEGIRELIKDYFAFVATLCRSDN